MISRKTTSIIGVIFADAEDRWDASGAFIETISHRLAEMVFATAVASPCVRFDEVPDVV